MRRRTEDERGAALVELAVAVPILLTLVFGVMEAGRGWSAKVQVTSASREAVRVLALGGTATEARAAAIAAAPGLTPALTAAQIATPATCPASGTGTDARVVITYAMPALTPIIPSGSITVGGTGVMRCQR